MTDIPPISVIQAQLGIGIKRIQNWGKMQCIDHCIFPIFLNQRPKIERVLYANSKLIALKERLFSLRE